MARQEIVLSNNNEVTKRIKNALRLLKAARAELKAANDNVLQMIDGTNYSEVGNYLGVTVAGLASTGTADNSDADTNGTTLYNLLNGAVADLEDGDVYNLMIRVLE